MNRKQVDGAELLVRCLEAHGVEYIFTVPGASIDPILNALVDHGPKIVVCRHEQNAAFMAQAWGRITGKPGVCLATAGPGLTNLVTGLATADAERCPVVAITGQVSHKSQFKRGHQNVDSVALFKPVTKWSVEAEDGETLPDIVANAFRLATEPREGATHLSIPVDLLVSPAHAEVVPPPTQIHTGQVPIGGIDAAAELIRDAKKPVIFLGLAASKPTVAPAVRAFLDKFQAPIVATFEAAGAVPRTMLERFCGRLGVFRNQPGDKVLAEADALITIGFDLIEYDPDIWNVDLTRPVIHIDEITATIDQSYQPAVELIGNIGANLEALGTALADVSVNLSKTALKVRKELNKRDADAAKIKSKPIHPLRFVHELRHTIDDETTVISDTGSHQYWLARNFYCFEPGHFLTSMGFQSMGVSIPWAIATCLARPGKKVVSVSGDGSFLMCSMELETAVRLQLPLVHFVWEDGSYNLVKIQEELKYKRHSGAEFGAIDTVVYAQAMGATAFRLEDPAQIQPTLLKAFKTNGPVVISVPIDYSDNAQIVSPKNLA